MATVLLTWELGGGLGHLVRLQPLAKGLCDRGHRVFVALRDLSRAEQVFGGVQVSYLQAPFKTRKANHRIDPPRTFAHILHNIGFGELNELRAMAEAWRNLYQCIRPDLIIFDHSPTALLAACSYGAKRVLVGNGFFCPSNAYPLPDLRPGLPDDSERLRQDEDQVLHNANQVLQRWRETPLERLSQLYESADENFLTTFRELDPYPDRLNAQYCGAWPKGGGKTPIWPEGDGKKIYAYLKPFPALAKLLTCLNRLRYPTLVYMDGNNADLQERFRSATLRFEDQPLDLQLVGKHCDLAILNGTHGTAVSMLLAGKPVLHLPFFLEQALTSASVVRIGAGLSAPLARPRQIVQQLGRLLSSERYAEAAGRFAASYADFTPAPQIDRILQRTEELLVDRVAP